MSMREMADSRKPKEIAEDIRRLDAKQFAALVTALCEDNIGNNLQVALGYELLDQSLNEVSSRSEDYMGPK